jgi:hypothetical protein
LSEVSIKAVVQKVITDGKHGPYAVASAEGLVGSITFSLEPTVWIEEDLPEEGTIVYLTNLRQKRAGWRAKKGQYFKLSDEQQERSNIMNEKAFQPKFLYPISRQYPIDEVCEKIIRQLEIHNWRVPGIQVEFDEYGTGEEKYRLVRTVSGDNFKLWFCRVQRRLGHYNDTAAVNVLNIPKMELSVYEDGSGPTFYYYVGSDWRKDKNAFVNCSKVNSKLNKEPRMYLCYSGRSNGATLVHNNDLGREYDPKGREPHSFLKDDIFNRISKWLEKYVLTYIYSQPIPTDKIDPFQPAEIISFPEGISSLYTFGEWQDVDRIIQGKKDKNNLEPNNRYGLIGSGHRLVPYNVSNDGSVPEIAYEGFCWCGLGEVDKNTPIDKLNIPGFNRWSDRHQSVIKITPNCANDIYVADISVREEYKSKIFQNDSKKERLSEEEYREFLRASGRTIIPISEYKNDYKEPVVLINRELSFDEVEVVINITR